MIKHCKIISILLIGLHIASCQGVPDAKTLYRRAFDKAHANDFHAAIDDLNKAIAMDSNFADAFLLRGEIKVSLGAPAYYNKGACMLNLGEYRDGCKLIYKAADMGYDLAVKTKPKCENILKGN
jgi:tetratricopeptide (TPR) repeat protein